MHSDCKKVNVHRLDRIIKFCKKKAIVSAECIPYNAEFCVFGIVFKKVMYVRILMHSVYISKIRVVQNAFCVQSLFKKRLYAECILRTSLVGIVLESARMMM